MSQDDTEDVMTKAQKILREADEILKRLLRDDSRERFSLYAIGR